MKFMRLFTFWNVLEQFKRQHQKHYENDADELKRYGFFKKSKASVVKLNELNPEQVFGITAMSNSMMIKGKNTIMKERIWINCADSEIVLQPLEPDTDTSKLHVKRFTAEEPSLHVNSTREMSLMKCGSHVKRVMTRSDDTDVGGTSLSRSTERCSAREFSRCVDLFKRFKTARPNLSYMLKVNEFASLMRQSSCPGTKSDKSNNKWRDLKHVREVLSTTSTATPWCEL